MRPANTQIRLGIRPVWLESLLSAWRKLGSLDTHRCKQQRLWSDWADAQADLSYCWVQSFCWFCHEVAQIALKQASDRVHFRNINMHWVWTIVLTFTLHRIHCIHTLILGVTLTLQGPTKIFLHPLLPNLYLNSVSSQWARGKSLIAWEPKSIPKFLIVRNFQKM